MKMLRLLKKIDRYLNRKYRYSKPDETKKPFINIVAKEMEAEQKRLLAKMVIAKAVEIYKLDKK